MEGGPSVKGTGVLPIVTALLAERAKLEPLLPERLKPYLDEDVDVTGWYPVEDILELLRIMAQALMPDIAKQRAFEYFGAVVAERDLLGRQDLVPVPQRIGIAGFYEGAISKKHDIATTVRRACGMNQLYFDAGEMTLKRVGERTLRFRHVGYPIVAEELCHITRGYFLQILRMIGVHGDFVHVSCRARGDAECDWHFVVPEGVDAAPLSAFEG